MHHRPLAVKPTAASVLAAGVGLALCYAPVPAIAQSMADFYKGKTVTMGISTGVGGGIDLYAKLVARHLGKHIPGNPTVVPRNTPGGGGLVLVNQLYKTAPRDGTTIGAMQQAVPFEPLFAASDSRAEFDPLKFEWLGSAVRFSAIAVAWNASTPVRKAEDLRTHELIVGASGVASSSTNDANVLRNILGFKYRVILGYPGGADTDLAMFRGETQGRANVGWEAVKTRNPDWVNDNKVSILYQMGLERHPDIPAEVPLILDFAKTPEDRQVLELKFASYGLGYPYAAPPGTPADKVAMLRKAVRSAIDDPDLRAEAAKLRLDIEPVSGESILDILRKAYGSSPEIRARLAEASKLPAKLEKAEPLTQRVTLESVGSEGRRVSFQDKGKSTTATIAAETQVTLRGQNTPANQIQPGMSCEVTYFGDKGQALTLACD